MPPSEKHMYLFGGDKPWLAPSWLATDDRVRGGMSQSHLTEIPDPDTSSPRVRFHGNLDISALGGAGFASQRSPDGVNWDLSMFGGLWLGVGRGDGMRYTLVVKDVVDDGLDGAEHEKHGGEGEEGDEDGDGKGEGKTGEEEMKGGDGRKVKSTVSWEYDFDGTMGEKGVKWCDLKPTYRGSPVPDAKPLDPRAVRRISIMMRSFFGEQQGRFSLDLNYIAAAEFKEP